MFRAIIVDDEKPALDILKLLLEKTDQICVVGVFSSAADALAGVKDLKPDVAFLDIEMSYMSGLELARKFVDMGIGLEIVFVTAYDKYALEAFRVNAVDYILKPFSSDDIARVITRLKRVNPLPAVSQIPADKGRIYCFGTLSVYGAGDDKAVKWRTAKAKELFAFMLENLNSKVAKWKIAQVIWPECEMEKQFNTYLYTTVYKVKKTLLSANIKFDFTFIDGSYIMELPEVYLDTAEFEELTASDIELSEASVEKYKRALSLYKGNYLEDNEYFWSQNKSDEYLRRYRILVSEFAKYYITGKDYSNAEKVLLEALKKAPLDDELNERLLKLYYTKKDKASLISHYSKIKELYKSDLGITPNKVMQELLSDISEL
ncbi:two-component SAPR family response regulator [Ruminiclostridium sufflavum DSM 19573]|uniref:Stage 0 sporulation protein A homolog n=1 Tax=Ruminiclostridium sufflavum DSM 19573 TaxID=1121337 RepID=A0A318XRX2_9FIRM|nr:response regulator [Ruminiclostridium sufflavum]PYG84310.1 two-component SAPR family response regulator [Ruminiclostridium sufflavum DSM 19573]